MNGRRLVLVFTAALAACTSTTPTPAPSVSATVEDHGAIVRLQTVPVPEGPPAPVFERGATAGDNRVRPLSDVRAYIPSPLPEPLEQPADCSFGGDLVVTFEDESELRCGPCERPATIDQLWAGMIFVLDNGECAPRCGPGGAFGPFEYAMQVPKPDDIGQPDWANSIIQSTWEKACASDLEKDGYRWGGRGSGVSDDGMIVTVKCDDGSRHIVQVVFEPA